jgi:hypothetical protein
VKKKFQCLPYSSSGTEYPLALVATKRPIAIQSGLPQAREGLFKDEDTCLVDAAHEELGEDAQETRRLPRLPATALKSTKAPLPESMKPRQPIPLHLRSDGGKSGVSTARMHQHDASVASERQTEIQLWRFGVAPSTTVGEAGTGWRRTTALR